MAWATRSKRNRATGAGVELAAIIHDYLTTGLFRAYPWLVDEFVRIVIVGHAQRVLPTSKPNTSRFVQRVLEQEGIEILTATAITGVTETMVKTSAGVIPARRFFWAAGIAASDIVRQVPVQHAPNGAIIVDTHFSGK